MVGGPARHDQTIPALDGLRALAILIVMASHVGLEHVLPGQFGVTLFFFLSGYLITTLLRRELEESGRIDFGRFYLRRAVRIMPPLYLTLLFVAGLSLAGVIHPIAAGWLPADALFLSNYLPFSGMPIGLWSLAVEEHFYMAFPLAFLFLGRRLSAARCAAVFVGVCAAVLLVRCWEVGVRGELRNVTFWTHTRLDSILFGSVLALWNNPVIDRGNVLPSRAGGYLLAFALLVPTFVIRDEAFRQTLRYTLQGMGLIALFNPAIRDRTGVGRLLDNAAARWVAALSYTIYLVHSALVTALTPVPHQHPLAPTVAALALAFVYAAAMRRWVEQPLARWRRRKERGLVPQPASVVEPDLVRS